MIFKDYYKILGLETNRVSPEDIKVAYRLQAKKYHPDVNVGNKLAEERIKDINEAYRVLSTMSTKRKYDRKWTTYVGYNGIMFNKKEDSKQILRNMLFGSENEKPLKKEDKIKKPERGENVETSVSTNIYEAFFGLEKKISLRTIDGKIKTIRVAIPEGIMDGEKIRLIGQGKPGINGGRPGDLLIRIDIANDKKFKLNGSDLYTYVNITPWEAALGSRVEIKSIDEKTMVYIPKGVQSGEVLKIPGKGYKKTQDKRGDLIVEVKIMVPKKLTNEEKQLFEKLNKVSKFNPRNS